MFDRRTSIAVVTAIALSAWSSAVVAATNEIKRPFVGVRVIHSVTTSPRLLDMWIAEIDPKAAGVSFLVTPSNGDLPGEVTPQTTRDFVTKRGAQLGVNGSFFAVAKAKQFNVSGLSVSNGDAYSEFEPRYRDALNLSKDNVATIIKAVGTGGTEHKPNVPLYNAVGGSARLVTNGRNVADKAKVTHPRTAAGVTADGKLLLVTIDGRYPLHSIGVTLHELADVLIRWGAKDGINFDGGGSTSFVMDDPRTEQNDPRVFNVPCDPLPPSAHGKERRVANSLAVFAKRENKPTEDELVYADFEEGDCVPFNLPLSFSGANAGLDFERSKVELIKGNSRDGNWFQRLTIVDDPKVNGGGSNPRGAWFVRHGTSMRAPAASILRPASGSVGLWARTKKANLRISISINDGSLPVSARGVAKSLAADGEWHRYFWKIDEPADWMRVGGAVERTFALDSIEIFGPPAEQIDGDATIDLDSVTHILPDGIEARVAVAKPSPFREAAMPPEILLSLPGVSYFVPTGWCNQ
jgi:hypothetical protein